MKSLILTSILTLSTVTMAETTQYSFKCTSETNSGRLISVSGCLKGEPSESQGVYETVACKGEQFEYITIQRQTSIAKMTPDMIETVKIPGRLFKAGWFEDGFELNYSGDLGTFKLEVIADVDTAPQVFNINMLNFNHSFKAVHCAFTLN